MERSSPGTACFKSLVVTTAVGVLLDMRLGVESFQWLYGSKVHYTVLSGSVSMYYGRKREKTRGI